MEANSTTSVFLRVLVDYQTPGFYEKRDIGILEHGNTVLFLGYQIRRARSQKMQQES